MEKAKVTMDGGREMSLVYGVPSPSQEGRICLVIAHGAGAPMFSPFIGYFHAELAKRGFLTVKFNFPYMEERKKFPDKPDVLKASYARIVDAVRSSDHRPARVFIGGKSMGGRIASMAAADGVNVDGLFFLGYPLHAPGRTDRLRDEHLYKISKPMLFVSGTNDAFASRQLLERVITRIGPSAQIHWVEGGDHSFNTASGKDGKEKTYQEVVSLLSNFVSGLEAT
jgi:predicted alpha/beta-hydrolase family hydrolase